MGAKRSFGEISPSKPESNISGESKSSGVAQFAEAAASGNACEVERRMQCHHCRGTARQGLFGPPGMRLMSKMCSVCQGTGLSLGVEAKMDGALALASHAGHQEVVSLLLSKGADTEARAINGDLPLVRAVAGNHVQVASLLLSARANPGGVGQNHLTPLQNAVEQSNADMVKLLLDSRANPDLKGVPDGSPPLCTAAHKGCSEIVTMLIDARANLEIKAKDNLNATPLNAAAREGNTKACEVLVAAGSDIEARDKLGRTPLKVIVRGNFCDAAAVLIAARADPFAKSNAGVSPVAHAQEAGSSHAEMLAMLEAYAATS